MINLIRNIQNLQNDINVGTSTEHPNATITLTRTAIQAITTAGTLITWQQKVRGQQITWSTTDITIPTDGFYMIQTRFATSVNVTLFQQIVLNGTILGYFSNSWTVTGFHTGTTYRYFSVNDVIQIRLLPSANCNVNQNAKNTLAESPYLHIVQITPLVD